MAAPSGLMSEHHYRTLGLSTDASQQEIKNAFLKLTLKWHPQKTKRMGAKKKLGEITEAYEALITPKIHRVENGQVVFVSLSHQVYDTAAGTMTGFFAKFNVFSWFQSSSVGDRLGVNVDNAFELLAEYMYDGDLGDFFTDADGTLHVIASIPLARALIGGAVTYKIPTGTGTEEERKEEVSGILDGYWTPMKRVTLDERQIWVIFKVDFPKDMSEEDRLELRQKLLLAQTSAAIIPALWGWLRAHPKTSTMGLLSALVGGVALLRRASLFQIARHWIV